jgi:hypothetical protein
MKHPQFQDGPFLYRPTGDRIRFVEATEDEILDIYGRVHGQTDYEYEIEEGQINVGEYVDFLNDPEVQAGAEEFAAKQSEGLRLAPKL